MLLRTSLHLIIELIVETLTLTSQRGFASSRGKLPEVWGLKRVKRSLRTLSRKALDIISLVHPISNQTTEPQAFQEDDEIHKCSFVLRRRYRDGFNH